MTCIHKHVHPHVSTYLHIYNPLTRTCSTQAYTHIYSLGEINFLEAQKDIGQSKVRNIVLFFSKLFMWIHTHTHTHTQTHTNASTHTNTQTQAHSSWSREQFATIFRSPASVRAGREKSEFLPCLRSERDKLVSCQGSAINTLSFLSPVNHSLHFSRNYYTVCWHYIIFW